MQKIYFLLALFLVILTPALSMAGEARLMAAFDAWEVYTFTEDGHKVCYIASQPGNKAGKYTKRGDSFAMITNRPADHTKNVLSYVAGYTYKPESAVKLTIDGQEFTLFTQGNAAWAQDSGTDDKITNAIKSGKEMKVVGTSTRGTVTTDSLSLKGAGSAYKKMSQECGG